MNEHIVNRDDAVTVPVMLCCNLRGPALEWYDALHPYLMFSTEIRRWFMNTVFLEHKERFSEFLLECPSTEVCLECALCVCAVYVCVIYCPLHFVPIVRYEVSLPNS